MNSDDRKRFFHRLVKVIMIIVAFVVAVSFIYIYLHERFMRMTDACLCGVPMRWILIILTSLGVLVGMFTYYYLMDSFKEEKESLTEGAEETLRFLDKETRKVMETIIDQDGEIHQSKIVEKTGLDRVKVSRKLSQLEDKGIIEKEKSGVSNLIKLKEPYKTLYIQ